MAACSRVAGTAVFGLLLLGLCGCARRESSACQGLVYKESGLGREEYLPCARAMVDELDRYYNELKTMADKSLPMRDRQRGHQGCLAANARLVKLIRQAGGSEKLARVPWEDSALSRVNQDIISAQNVYLMYCFYGVGGMRDSDLGPEDSSHVDARSALAGMR